ncbi:twin-arginine translocase TatA/TatE family subunit [Solirubrobacter phytolaccae]|uniref:Sec-independent protein translocase protein TatA n=1 Tax=Solirubrobacter phytolaccae TaxID=1404360 RepID=A0A9X3S8Y6_9ACTN|nr:twin-arginine translocase TatA/TatE family subunit [Solirubrobacter phytolaccae]MDA0182103.1 twin-arginine translocase TatA/TatE family subunit [Solirubrobacter phytolaccae]
MGIGPMEIVIVALIALIVLGPKKLPDAGRSLGKGLREFKGALSSKDEPDDAEIERRVEAASARQAA